MTPPEVDPTDPARLAELVALAREVALDAGELLLAYLPGGGAAVDLAGTAATKSSRTDLVTKADRASEDLIVARLAALRPDDAVLAEEGGGHDGTSGLTWVVDPLDGTVNFVYGLPFFAVSIACVDDAGGLVGVVHDPLRQETFEAVRGGGATFGGLRLAGRSGVAMGEALIGTGFGYGTDRRARQAELLTKVLPAARDIRRSGSAALDLCSVAAGRLDAFYEAGLGPWDLAAGALVVTEAGGVVELVDGLVAGATTVFAGPADLVASLRGLLGAGAGRAPGTAAR